MRILVSRISRFPFNSHSRSIAFTSRQASNTWSFPCVTANAHVGDDNLSDDYITFSDFLCAQDATFLIYHVSPKLPQREIFYPPCAHAHVTPPVLRTARNNLSFDLVFILPPNLLSNFILLVALYFCLYYPVVIYYLIFITSFTWLFYFSLYLDPSFFHFIYSYFFFKLFT